MNSHKPQKEILVLHGWGGSKQSWQACINKFDKSKYKFYVPDLPGFGSTPAPSKPWSVNDYAGHVKKLMKDYDIKHPICIAHSFGGRIAIKLAAKDKNIFSKLVLVGAAGIKRKPSFKVRLFKNISKIGKKILSILHLQIFESIAGKIIHKIAGAHDYSKAEGKMRETFKLVIEEDLKALLQKIETKTCIIWGEKDSYVPVEDAHIMNKEIKKSKIKIFKDGKHGLHIQMPEKLAQTISNFIEND